MTILVYQTYFPCLAQAALMLQAEKVYMEVCGNYEKQTYRNRTLIYGANGKQTLSIPVHYTQTKRQLYKDVRISYAEPWQADHKKAIEAAYKSSPFFEFYEYELLPLFERKDTFLLDFNTACFEKIEQCLDISVVLENSMTFEKTPSKTQDYRTLVNPKTLTSALVSYTQVFSSKYGFIDNLSILDLLFNEGPNSVNYLLKQQVRFIEQAS
ncbi:MAG TPA: WbqC family protein [Flavobacteriaceae bacterium]|nr:WbqC family protein [Flavobacteriaceae bacterium]